MSDSGDEPPRKKKRAKRKEPDFVIDPANPNKTIELETADLLQLGQSGIVETINKNKTRELQLADLEELREGAPVDPKIIVDLGPDPNAPPKEQTVFVDFGPDPARAQRASTPMPVQSAPAVHHPQAHPISASTPVTAQAAVQSPLATPASGSMTTSQTPASGSMTAKPLQFPASGSMTATPAPAHVAMSTQPSVVVGEPRSPIPAAAPQARAMSPMNVQRVTPTMPRVEVPARSSSEFRVPRRAGGTWLVVLVYLLSAAALGISIYFRWFDT